MQRNNSSVSEALTGTGAYLERAGFLSQGLSLAVWKNDGYPTDYEWPDHHTLSLYLSGGDRVVREDRKLSGGAPGKICLLPAGHLSRWSVGAPVRMLHLYIAPAIVEHQALDCFGIRQGAFELKDLTFLDDASIAMIMRGGILPFDWRDRSDRLALDSACHLLIHHIIKRHVGDVRSKIDHGGLSPRVRRRICDFIEASLELPLTLDRLALEARLSKFHFAKMFRVSFGVSPHRYLMERRGERAKQLLRDDNLTLADVALACGFASQSHFTKAFKVECGVTPGEWRKTR
nr:AraC family transcriptional regulator [Rhizobium leucaenae]